MNNKFTHSMNCLLPQEQNRFNKPNVLIKSQLSQAITHKESEVFSVLVRMLLITERSNFDLVTDYDLNCDYADINNFMSDNHTSKDIRKILEKLLNTTIRFNYIHNGKCRIRNTKIITAYEDSKGRYDKASISFDHKLIKVLIEKVYPYTKLNEIEQYKLSNIYSTTFYEYFKLALGNKLSNIKYFSESELRKKFFLENKYKNIKEFNKFVIKKALTEINSHTSLNIEYKVEKDEISNERIYKFKIEDIPMTENILNISEFKNLIKNMSKKNREIIYKYRNNNYYLGEQLDFYATGKILWIIENSDKTTSKIIATKIWNNLYKEYLQNSEQFAEKYYDLSYKELLEDGK